MTRVKGPSSHKQNEREVIEAQQPHGRWWWKSYHANKLRKEGAAQAHLFWTTTSLYCFSRELLVFFVCSHPIPHSRGDHALLTTDPAFFLGTDQSNGQSESWCNHHVLFYWTHQGEEEGRMDGAIAQKITQMVIGKRVVFSKMHEGSAIRYR